MGKARLVSGLVMLVLALTLALDVTQSRSEQEVRGVRSMTIYASKDAYVDSSTPNENHDYPNDQHYGTALKIIGSEVPGMGTAYIYLYFNLSEIPSDATISSAILKLTALSSINQSEETLTGSIWRVGGGWSENTITWNSQPLLAQGYYAINIVGKNFLYFTYDIIGLVNEWLDGTYMNNGLCLKAGAAAAYKTFIAYEYPTGNDNLPQLIVTYTTNTYFISGYVIDYSAGEPVANAKVTLSGDASKETWTSSNGYYRFEDLEPGTYIITPELWSYNFDPEDEGVTITNRDFIQVNFDANPWNVPSNPDNGWSAPRKLVQV